MTSSPRSTAKLLWLPLVLLAWLGASLGCDESGPRIFTAREYRPLPGCLEAYAPLSLVEASDVSALCDPVCLRVADRLYVSTVCAPYPLEASLAEPDEAACAAALVAPGCDELAADAAAP